MKFNLTKATETDIEYIKYAKLYNIFKYAHDLSDDEIERINNYANKTIPLEIKDYRMITINDVKIGCVFVANKDDGVMLDEIFVEKEYRGKGIGTKIINDIIKNNKIVYLWVYKDNKKAISLYERLGFIVKDETQNRFYMMKSN